MFTGHAWETPSDGRDRIQRTLNFRGCKGPLFKYPESKKLCSQAYPLLFGAGAGLVSSLAGLRARQSQAGAWGTQGKGILRTHV